MWYLIAVWTGSDTGHASDLYQPVAFLWFTAAVAALECGTWAWYRRQVRRPGIRRHWPRLFSAEYLAGLTGGIFFCHVLFLNLIRAGLGDAGISAHLDWAALVAPDVRADDDVRRRVHRAAAPHPAALGAHRTDPGRAAGAPGCRRHVS